MSRPLTRWAESSNEAPSARATRTVRSPRCLRGQDTRPVTSATATPPGPAVIETSTTSTPVESGAAARTHDRPGRPGSGLGRPGGRDDPAHVVGPQRRRVERVGAAVAGDVDVVVVVPDVAGRVVVRHERVALAVHPGLRAE